MITTTLENIIISMFGLRELYVFVYLHLYLYLVLQMVCCRYGCAVQTSSSH
jgi:hypothetical protein